MSKKPLALIVDDDPHLLQFLTEVIGHAGKMWAPKDVRVANPAFDVTPARLVTALITERGIVRQPNAARIKAEQLHLPVHPRMEERVARLDFRDFQPAAATAPAP